MEQKKNEIINSLKIYARLHTVKFIVLGLQSAKDHVLQLTKNEEKKISTKGQTDPDPETSKPSFFLLNFSFFAIKTRSIIQIFDVHF